MAKKRYFKKKAVLRAIGKYTRRKMSYVTTVYWNGSSQLYIDGQQANVLTIGEILSGNTSEFQTLGKQYAMVKLRGISVEAVGHQYNAGYNFGLCIGQANDSIQFNNLRT